RPGVARVLRICALVFAISPGPASSLFACPCCTALRPSLAQQREDADVVALAEVLAAPKETRQPARLRLHQILTGRERIADVKELSAPLDVAAKSGQLLLLFGKQADDSDQRAWHAVPVDETSYAY